MLKAGDRLGRYEILAELKSGGMATLHLARRLGVAGFAKSVAIKVVHGHLARDPTFVRMFIDEAMLSAKIVHPNVVHVEELGHIRGKYFLAMEYVPGCSLAQLMTALRQRSRALTPDLAVWIASQVADALHAAHETRGDDGELLGVVHRDVSPQNVLISDQGQVKLIDFGIAKARGRTLESSTGTLKGKLRYMAPEQARAGAVDRRSDVFALGVVLWEMLTSRRLFDAVHDLAVLEQVRNPQVEPPSRFAEDVPPELDAVVLATLSADPSERPETALELRCLLADAVPRAHVLAPSQLAALLGATLGDTIAATRALARHGAPAPRNDDEDAPDASRTLAELTVNVNAATVPDEPDALDPMATAIELARHAAALPDLRANRSRWWTVGASTVAVGCVFAVATAWIRLPSSASTPPFVARHAIALAPATPPPESVISAASDAAPATDPVATAPAVVSTSTQTDDAPDAGRTHSRRNRRDPGTQTDAPTSLPPRDRTVHLIPGTSIPSEFPM